jgi:hypothetical protein
MRNFNEEHLQECATGICLGGNIRLNHVKALLKEKALDVQRAQIGGGAIPQQHSENWSFYKKREREYIPGLTKQQAVESSYQELKSRKCIKCSTRTLRTSIKQRCRDSTAATSCCRCLCQNDDKETT